MIRDSTIISDIHSVKQINELLSNMNIRETSLLYKMDEDELNSAVLWDNCKNHNQTITFLKTDVNSIIGFYCPDKFEETKFKKDSEGYPGWKDIVNGKPFIFYF